MAKRKGRRAKKAKAKNEAPPASPEPPFDFFGLPGEMRNMVYDELWKMKNRVAAYHTPTGTGILAYDDGLVLDESEVMRREDLDYERNQVPRWRPDHCAGLPTWLLASKMILDEGLAQFRREAHSNIWPIITYVPSFNNFDKHPSETLIMNPTHARSLSIARMPSAKVGDAKYAYRGAAPTAHIDVALTPHDQDWLRNLVQHLGTSPQARKLKVGLEISQIPFQRTVEGFKNRTYGIRFPFHDLIKACKQVQTLEVELFHYYDSYLPTGDILDTELLQQFRPQFTSAIGDPVTETMTMTVSRVIEIYDNFNGRQLFDRKLVYIKG